MELSELSISDLSALLTYYSRKMSKVQERTPENSAAWEQFAFRKSCCASEFERRIKQINFPALASKKLTPEQERMYDAIMDNTDHLTEQQVKELLAKYTR